jgi:hypothetical protein
MDNFLVPSSLQSDRKFVIRSTKKICKYLKLKTIPVVYDDCNTCYYNHTKYIIGSEHFIGMGIPYLKGNWDDVFDYVNAKFKDRRGKLFFIVAHELAHYMQTVRHANWKSKSIEKDDFLFMKNFATNEQYRKFRKEANADKIAIIICKKYGYTLDKD